MTRRTAVRRAMLLGFGMALQKLDALHASEGLLTVDLNQWSHVVFKFGKKTIRVPMSEIFDALENPE